MATAFGVFSTYVALYRRYPRSGSRSYLPTRAAPLALAHKSYLPTPGSLGEGGIPRTAALRTRNGSQGFKKEEKKKRGDKEKRETKSAAPGPSRVVPHRSTTPAQTCLTSLFGWEAVSQADMAALKTRLTSYLPTLEPSIGPRAKTYLPTIWDLRYRAT